MLCATETKKALSNAAAGGTIELLPFCSRKVGQVPKREVMKNKFILMGVCGTIIGKDQ